MGLVLSLPTVLDDNLLRHIISNTLKNPVQWFCTTTGKSAYISCTRMPSLSFIQSYNYSIHPPVQSWTLHRQLDKLLTEHRSCLAFHSIVFAFHLSSVAFLRLVISLLHFLWIWYIAGSGMGVQYTVGFDLRQRFSSKNSRRANCSTSEREYVGPYGGVVWSMSSIWWSLGRRGEWVVHFRFLKAPRKSW